MSSSLSAERTPIGTRAVLVLTVFSSFGLGAITSSIVYLILLAAFKGSIETNISHLEWVWRLLLGIGIIPAACTLYARLTMKESKPYEKCTPFAKNYLQILSKSNMRIRCRKAHESHQKRSERVEAAIRRFSCIFQNPEARHRPLFRLRFLVPLVSCHVMLPNRNNI